MTGPGLDDLTQSLGDGGGLDPQMEAMKPAKRRAIFLTVAGVAILVLIVVIVVMRNRPAELTPGQKTATGDTVVAVTDTSNLGSRPADGSLVAQDTSTSGGTGPALIDTSVFQTQASGATAPGTGLVGPDGAPVVPGEPTGGLVAPTGTGGLLTPAAPPGSLDPGATPAGMTPGGGLLSGVGGGEQAPSQDSIKRAEAKEARLRADSLRAATKARQDSLRLAAYLARESKLRGGNMMLSIGEGGALDGVLVSGARAAGSSRYDLPGLSATEGGGTASGGGLAGTNPLSDVPPGTQVTAITVAPYEEVLIGGGAAGGNGQATLPLEMRLTSPLRRNGRIVLPAGTKAYGTVTMDQQAQQGLGGGGMVPYGLPVRVNVRVETFVTPSGEVYRGVPALAVNPATATAGFTPSVSRQPLQRVGRAMLQTGLDFVITANTARFQNGVSVGGVPVVTTPSPRDIAILNTLNRSADLVRGLLGDETTDMMRLRLPVSTPVILVFGF